MDRTEKLKLFVNEINDIKDDNIRKFAEELIGNADDYFFSVPASSSGKYHPQFDLGKGGLVRHTRCVTFIAESIAESYDLDDEYRDLLIVSALAHDIKKQGDNTGHTVREHPILASKYVKELNESAKILTKPQMEIICRAVECHMGKWEHQKKYLKFGDEPYPMPKSDLERALQAADYIASRKEILDFNFRPTEQVIVEEAEPKKYEGEPGDYIINFGKKYGGQNKTIREIHESEKASDPTRNTYIEWMVTCTDFHFVEAQEMARKYLDSLNKKDIITENKETSNEVDDLPF